MSLQTIGGLMEWPPVPWGISGGMSLNGTTFVIDAAGEKAAIVCQAVEDITIRNVCFRTSTVTTGDTVDVRIETVSLVNGDPTGTLWAANTNVAHVVNNADDNAWLTTANLTADAVIPKGSWYAIVIVNGGGGGNIQITCFADPLDHTPYGDLFTASWAKQTNRPCVIAKTSAGAFVNHGPVHHIPASAVADTTFNSGSSPDERGNVMILPFTCRVVGCWSYGAMAGNAPFDMVLYDSGGSVLASTSFDSDVDRNVGSASPRRLIFDDAPVTLTAGATYRLVMKPTSGTNAGISSYTLPDAAIFDTIPGGQNVHYTFRVDGGAFDDTVTTQRVLIGLLIDQLDDGAGGSGGSGNVFGGMVVR